MKRGTPDHPKTEALAMHLDICIAQAVGHLEMLFHFVARFAPRGDVGRYPDEMIARRCGWSGDNSKFISALVECRWLEKCDENRLIVHDWSDHAEDAVRKLLIRKKWSFAEPVRTQSGHNPDTVRTMSRHNPDTVRTQYGQCRDQPTPSHTPTPTPSRTPDAVRTTPSGQQEPIDGLVERFIQEYSEVGEVPDDIWREMGKSEFDAEAMDRNLGAWVEAYRHRYAPNARKFIRDKTYRRAPPPSWVAKQGNGPDLDAEFPS